MALVEVIYFLITDIATAEDLNDQGHVLKQLNGLYDLLLERTLDVSVYVRSKALSVLTRLCDLPVKFPKQRLAITEVAVACLEDSSSIVRKAAVVLLGRLIMTHPYGLIHGGLLQLKEWEERYAEVKEQLAKVQGEVEKVIEVEQGQEGGQEGEDEEDDGEEAEDDDEEGNADEDDAQSKRRKSRKKRRQEDEMDIDGEEGGEGDEDEEEEEPEGGEDVEMEDAENGEGEAPPKKKSKKRKGRKSELNIAGFSDANAIGALQGEELMQLKLKKRYYAEGLSFIRQIESSLKIIEDLLASKSKAEVLEAMDFFRILHEYQFDGAEVCLI